MKTLLIGTLTSILAFSAASAQVAATTTTTTTTEPALVSSSGTITTYTAGKNLVVQEQTGPVTYIHNPDAAYVFKGIQLTPAEAQARIRAGLPVKVEYAPQGTTRVVKRVIIDDDTKIKVDADDDDDEVKIKVEKD